MAKDLLLDDLNEAQREAVTYGDGPLLIVAGAGTGKTTVITRRIAWLIREGKAKGDEILGLTFTDKAAGEMEERVDKLLPMGYVDLWLSTFHSFGERILKAHAIDIGLPNDFKLLDQTGQWLLARRNFDRFDLDYYRPLGNPTKFIHALLKHFSRAKDEGIGPDEYLEYVEGLKLNSGVGESAGGAVIKKKVKSKKSISTNVILEGPRLDGGPIGSSGDSIASLQNDSEGEVGRLEEIAKAYKVYEQLLLDEECLDFGDLIMYTLRLLKARSKILEQYRNQFKYVLVDEFQDTNWAQYELVKLLATHPVPIRSGHPSQEGNSKVPSYGGVDAKRTGWVGKANLTVVADDDQSIYRFRGAAMSNILQFEKDYPHAKFVVLTQNYRSKQRILDLSYQFIQKNNPNRLEARVNTPPGPSQEGNSKVPSHGGVQGWVGIVKKLQAVHSGAATISLLQAKTGEDEIGMVIDKIIALKESNHDLSWNDFAILVRANAQADAYVQALSSAGIPCQYVASKGLYAKPIILDVVNWLKLLDNYHESPSLWRVLASPSIAMPWNDVTELTGYAHKKSLSLYEALKHTQSITEIGAEGRKTAERVLALIERETQASRTLSVGKVIMQFLEESGYLKHLSKLPEEQAREQFAYLNQFFKTVTTFEQSVPDASVRSFLDAHGMEIESGDAGALEANMDEGPEAVKVMTVHAAKGLEFHTVFVVQLVDKRFPSIERGDPIELPQGLVKEIVPEGDIHLEEERRLFYVAMTRAKENLFFTLAEDYGGMRKKKPSVFLYELGLVKENVGALHATPVRVGANSVRPHVGVAYMRPVPPVGVLHESPVQAREHVQYKFPERFSFTQLKAFETCPYQYRFAHILKVPVKGRFTFSFGKTMHATLQQFFELMKEGGGQGDLFGRKKESAENLLPSLKVLMEFYEKNWIDDWYESKRHQEEYREKGRKILEEFYEKISAQPPQPKYLEQGFNLKLYKQTDAVRDADRRKPTPAFGHPSVGGDLSDMSPLGRGAGVGSHIDGEVEVVTIKGVIDRIDEIEGGVEIIDYKTGRAKDLDTADKDQLLIYQVAATEVLGLKPLKLTYYYLDEQKPVSFFGTEEQIEKIKAKILETVEAIKTSDFKATPGPQVCRFCDFKEICEFRQL